MSHWDTDPGTYTRSRQLFDLGLDPGQGHNVSYVTSSIPYLQKRFDLVMIVGRLDESLILFKVDNILLFLISKLCF